MDRSVAVAEQDVESAETLTLPAACLDGSGVRFATLWLCILCACQAPPATQFEIVRPLSLAQCVPDFEAHLAPVVLTVGQLETITFAVQASLVCNGVSMAPDGFFVEAVDDANRPVALEVRHEVLNSRLFEVNVTLRTPETSAVHFRLRGEPSIGQHQQSVPAFHTETRSWLPLPAATGCLGLIEGPGGREVCIGLRGVSVTLQSGEVWSRSDVLAVAVTPHRLWLFGPRIDSYRFDANEEGVLANSWPLAISPSAIDVRGEKVFVAGSLPSGVAFLQLEESGASAGPIRVTQPLVIGAARFVSDDEVLLARGHLSDVVRPAALDGSVELTPSTTSRAFVLSASVDGVWRSDDSQLSVTRTDGGFASAALAATPPLPMLPPLALTDVVPLWAASQTTSGALVTGVPVESPDGGLEWRYVETLDSTVPVWSSSRWLFARGQNGVLFRAPRRP